MLTILYKFYLSGYQSEDLDTMTVISGNTSEQLLKLFNYDIIIQKNSQNPWQDIILNGKYIARITEGCNAISVMILFVSFVMAFSGSFKKTSLFIILGIISIYILNVTRISLLIVLVYNFPQYTQFLHGTFFPLMIYGYVFILWILWINRFSKYAK